VNVRGRSGIGRASALLLSLALPLSFAFSMEATAFADPVASTTVDRIAVRYSVPETGGATKPRFVTERELRFWARIEATIDEGSAPADFYVRYARTALDRFIAEDMLASLLIERGAEPPDLPKAAEGAREELETRLPAASRLTDLMKLDGISETELMAFMRRRVRATTYVDRVISPILKPGEDEIFQGFRTMPSPFRALAYEDARSRFLRFYVHERFRSLSLDFVKGARARLMLTILGAAAGQP